MKVVLLVLCALFVYINAETNIHFNFDGMIPPLPTCDCSSVCGDGICADDEDELICPNDCFVPEPDCGDGACDEGVGEDPFNCPQDCSSCGDNVCDNTEDLVSCPVDCIACGDGTCSPGETLASCAADCSNICGNEACETGEDFNTCPQDCGCSPTCGARQCGDDGCGGSCGTCPAGTQCDADGMCVCTPSCAGRNCGDDGCGGSCGTCSAGSQCNNGICEDVCTPSCAGRACGNDGCGGSCGTCPAGTFCDANGVCQSTCSPNCAGRNCGSDGCGGSCGTCPAGTSCDGNGVCQAVCSPNCAGRNCGGDGCGGSCGTCSAGFSCNGNGVCEADCSPNCAGRNCGDDGCGGSCGTCSGNFFCNGNGVCEEPVCTPNCVGRTCGDDGCGSVCGTCQAGFSCVLGTCESDTGAMSVSFTIWGISGESIFAASGISCTSGSNTAQTNAAGEATLLVLPGAEVSFSNGGGLYESITFTVSEGTSSLQVLLPPPIPATGAFAAAIWSDPFTDLDLNMFAPGNSTHYGDEWGVVNWSRLEKEEELPYSSWTMVNGDIGCEYISINQLKTDDMYQFMLFHWDRVGGGNPDFDFSNSNAWMFFTGGSETGLGSWYFQVAPPSPPAGFAYGYWSPLDVRVENGIFQVVPNEVDAYEPPISISAIDSPTEFLYPCDHGYCPYSVPF